MGMDHSDSTRAVKPRVARGAVRRAKRVEVCVRLADGSLGLFAVSKRQALISLARARGLVEVCDPFGDRSIILGG